MFCLNWILQDVGEFLHNHCFSLVDDRVFDKLIFQFRISLINISLINFNTNFSNSFLLFVYTSIYISPKGLYDYNN